MFENLEVTRMANAMAERAGVDFIITRDRAAFVRSTIKTFSPAEFIRAFPIPEE